MAFYVNSFAALSSAGLCHVPARESICLSMAIVGFLCLAAGLALVLREGRISLAYLPRD